MPTNVASLRRGFAGRVLLPDGAGYNQARRVWNAMVDRRPAVIARCAGTADVAAAVRFGRGRGLEIGVRGGGHNIAGLAVPAGGLMIDLSLMGAVRVDPGRRRGWVQGGALLGTLDRAAQSSGLATTAGNVSHTGVGGLTLGGGMGWLARQFGLACDNVARFELVSADGEILHASETENRDLFWGLRGGGGNFGIVTEFEFHLHPTAAAALTADLFYAPRDAPQALRRWRDLIASAPPRATLTAWAGAAGDWPFLPPGLRGRPMVSVGYVWTGDPDHGQALLPALRGGTRPVAEQTQRLTYLQLQSIDDDAQAPGQRRYWKGHYLREFGDDAIGAFVSCGARDGDGQIDPALLASGDLQAYGGAIAAVGHGETAFSHRDALIEFVARAGWTDPAEDQARISIARQYGAAIEPYASGAYVNDLTDEGAEGVRRAYGTGQMPRLASLKDRYDPHNIFHLNHNIPADRPTTGPGTTSTQQVRPVPSASS
jgi:FAD/FMN-containing dehydrogenase